MDKRSTKIASCSTRRPRPTTRSSGSPMGPMTTWASWYAQWLVTLSELPEVLGATVVRSELTYMVVRLD
jgi:hypothetical protein